MIINTPVGYRSAYSPQMASHQAFNVSGIFPLQFVSKLANVLADGV
jgi:hypothetical protein